MRLEPDISHVKKSPSVEMGRVSASMPVSAGGVKMFVVGPTGGRCRRSFATTIVRIRILHLMNGLPLFLFRLSPTDGQVLVNANWLGETISKIRRIFISSSHRWWMKKKLSSGTESAEDPTGLGQSRNL